MLIIILCYAANYVMACVKTILFYLNYRQKIILFYRVFYWWARLPACWVLWWCHREPCHQDQVAVGPIGKRQNLREVPLPSCYIRRNTHQKWPLVLQKPLPVSNTQLNTHWLCLLPFLSSSLNRTLSPRVAKGACEDTGSVLWMYCIWSHVRMGEFK